MPILQESEGKAFIVIPKAIKEALGWKKGDDIQIEILSDKSLKLKRVEQEK